MVHSGPPSLCTALKESFDEDDTNSGAEGSYGSLDPRGCNEITPIDPITATPAPENTLPLQTIPTVTVQTAAPQLGIELLPIQ
jgi:hypothetical protein